MSKPQVIYIRTILLQIPKFMRIYIIPGFLTQVSQIVLDVSTKPIVGSEFKMESLQMSV